MRPEIREEFWEKIREVDRFLNRIKIHARHLAGLRFSVEFEKAYEKFKKSVEDLDFVMATYLG